MTHCVEKLAHQSQHTLHIRHDIFSVPHKPDVRNGCAMRYARLARCRDIDLFTIKHALDGSRQTALPARAIKQFDGF